MNLSIDRNAARQPLISALPLAILARVELAMLTRDYAQFLKAPPEEDRWFVTRGSEALPPQKFREVLHRLAKVEGYTFSGTSAFAPKDAQKAYTRARESLKKKKWDEAERDLRDEMEVNLFGILNTRQAHSFGEDLYDIAFILRVTNESHRINKSSEHTLHSRGR